LQRCEIFTLTENGRRNGFPLIRFDSPASPRLIPRSVPDPLWNVYVHQWNVLLTALQVGVTEFALPKWPWDAELQWAFDLPGPSFDRNH